MRTVIQRSRGAGLSGLKELWNFRELFLFVVWRDLKVRYRQAAIGAAWAVLQPLLFMLVLWAFLGRLARVPSDGIPYPLFAFSGLVPWIFFSQSLVAASNSVVQNSQLLTKVYFPRLILPFSAATSFILDFFIAGALLLGLLLFYGYSLTPRLILALPIAFLTLLCSLGLGTWLAAVNVRFRDVRHALPFLIQVWLFLTPVAYSSTLIPPSLRPWYGLNPMVGIIEIFRWALFGSKPLISSLAASLLTIVVLLISGVVYFQHIERRFADVV
jgi:lipopolysaccharide transport system permease protein